MSQNIKTTITRLVAAVALCAVMFAIFPAASIAQGEASSLQQIIDKLVTSYNKKDAIGYRGNFSEKLKEKLTLKNIENILDVGVAEQDPIISHSTDISPDGRRALVFVETESEKLDLHIRINSDNKIERLSWYSHKADPSGLDLSDHEKRKIKERYQPYADEFVQAIRDKNAQAMLSLMVKDEDDDWSLEDYQSFLVQMNSRGIQRVGELEVISNNEVLIPVYFKDTDRDFYLSFDKNNLISLMRISNYAQSESEGKSYADLGSDTLRTRDLLSFNQLREAFKKDSGKVRLITLLSPT